MSLSSDLSALYARDISRLTQELRAFPDDESLWQKLPGVNNSAGNLILHIEGNLRDFIGQRLGGIAYERQRDQEFAAGGMARAQLAERLEQLGTALPPVLAGLTEAQLDAQYPENVLGVPMSTRLFAVHLLLHLNLHMGQIDYLRRILTLTGAVAFAKLPA